MNKEQQRIKDILIEEAAKIANEYYGSFFVKGDELIIKKNGTNVVLDNISTSVKFYASTGPWRDLRERIRYFLLLSYFLETSDKKVNQELSDFNNEYRTWDWDRDCDIISEIYRAGRSVLEDYIDQYFA